MKHRLFVISDLHLGGTLDALDEFGVLIPGSTMFSSAKALAEFLAWLADEADANQKETYELCINGDIFDVLCAAGDSKPELRDAHAVSEADALKLTGLIFKQYGGDDDSDDSPLLALKRYLRGPGELTLLIGNHDVELSYPSVRAQLSAALEVGSARIRYLYDGEAYSIGEVVIEHGNRYDPWNAVDHDALRRDRSRMSRRSPRALPPDDRHFDPPAGSYIVAYIINELKRRYRFVDLLKPENETVFPLLMSLCPLSAATLGDIFATAPAIGRRRADARGVDSGDPANNGYLAATAAADVVSMASAALDARDRPLFPELATIETSLRAAEQLSSLADARTRLMLSAAKLRQHVRTMATIGSLLAPGSRERVLGRLGASLKALNRFDHFRTDVEITPYIDAAKRLVNSGGFAVVVFGHTHLPKFVQWQGPHGTATYINTGTWADVARIPADLVNGDLDAMGKFAEKLSTNNHAEYVRRYLMFAEIVLEDGKAQQAQLWRFNGRAAARGEPRLQP